MIRTIRTTDTFVCPEALMLLVIDRQPRRFYDLLWARRIYAPIYSSCQNPCALFFCLLFHRLAVRISLPFHTFYGHCTLPQERQIFNTVFLRVHVWPLYCNHLIGLFQKYHNTLCCIGFCLSFFLRLSASYYTSFTSLAFCWSYCPLPFEIDPTFFLFVCFSSNINTTLVRNVFSQSSNTYTMVCPLGVRI